MAGDRSGCLRREAIKPTLPSVVSSSPWWYAALFREVPLPTWLKDRHRCRDTAIGGVPHAIPSCRYGKHAERPSGKATLGEKRKVARPTAARLACAPPP